MEKWQREHIRKKLPTLLDLTTCNAKLLTILEKANQIGRSDKSRLKSIPDEEERVSEFWSLIQTRTAYPLLIKAFRVVQQNAVADLLYRGYVLFGKTPPPPEDESGESESEADLSSNRTTTSVATQFPPPVAAVAPSVRPQTAESTPSHPSTSTATSSPTATEEGSHTEQYSYYS